MGNPFSFTAVFISITAVLLFSGCTGLFSEKISVVLPHSGETVELDVTSRTSGQFSKIEAEKTINGRHIKIARGRGGSSGSGSGSNYLYYRDDGLEYNQTEGGYYGGQFNYHGVDTNCIRGSCSFGEMEESTWIFRENSAKLVCFRDGTYAFTYSSDDLASNEIEKNGSGCPDLIGIHNCRSSLSKECVQAALGN